MRAIELNSVAVENNKAAFAIGRLAAADPAACSERCTSPTPATRGTRRDGSTRWSSAASRFLTAYQNAALAARFRTLVDAVHAREQASSAPARRCR